MGRPGKVWWNTGKNAWYATIGGKKTRVAEGDKSKAEAENAWHVFHAKDIAPDLGLFNPVAVVFELYLDRIFEEGRPCYKQAKRLLQTFKDFHRDLQVKDLTATEVKRWLHYKPSWGPSSRSLAIGYLQAALNWAAAPEQRIIPRNPIDGLHRPGIRSRGAETLIDDADHETLLAGACPALRDVLFALRQTGTRPVNLCRVTAADCDFERGAIVLGKHKTAEITEQPIYIPISESLRPLLRDLCERHRAGAIFRNSYGRAWNSNAICGAISELRERLEKKGKRFTGKTIAYGYRHTVATELLEAGMPDAHVAQVLGHRDTKPLYKHYGHLSAKIKKLGGDMDRIINRKDARG